MRPFDVSAAGDDGEERADPRRTGTPPSPHGASGGALSPLPPDPAKTSEELEEGGEEEHPRATLFWMLVFLMVTVAIWGYVYWEMLSHS